MQLNRCYVVSIWGFKSYERSNFPNKFFLDESARLEENPGTPHQFPSMSRRILASIAERLDVNWKVPFWALNLLIQILYHYKSSSVGIYFFALTVSNKLLS